MDRTRTRVRRWRKLAENAAAIAEAQRGTLLLWMPAGLGCGIGLYFALRFEPSVELYAGIGLLAALCGGAAINGARYARDGTRRLLMAVCLVLSGVLLAGGAAHQRAAPVLRGHYYGPVTGRIIAIDRAASNRVRVTLDQVWIAARKGRKIPRKVRITLHYNAPVTQPRLAYRVMLTASLAGPSGPVEPGGFDFQRYAWFRGLGAVGYARTPLLTVAPPDKNGGAAIALARIRMDLANAIRARLKGQAGAFAAAILTGDRSAIQPGMTTVLRNSNLAHLLAISGLHMGLLTGFVFALVRYGLAFVPHLALRLPVKKVAAVGAFVAAVAYLLLSGANIATQRAFVMVAVALVAVLLDRRALTLRAVAAAAVIVLVLRPDSLIEAGFQMSFAATTALVAVFEAAKALPARFERSQRRAKFLRWGVALVASSFIAGLATAPISAFHFNRIAEYGLLANLATVPVMGFLVMPAAVMAILMAPLGLDAVFWAITGAGIDWILGVAGVIAGWKGAVLPVPKAPTSVLVLIAGGAILMIVLRGRVRLGGLAPIVLGFAIWAMVPRPDILLSENGRLLGLSTVRGRWLSKAKGNGFVARNWLENDGESIAQDIAARRLPKAGRYFASHSISGVKIAYFTGKKPDIKTLCAGTGLLILPRVSVKTAPCPVLDRTKIAKFGAIAGRVRGGHVALIGAREITGQRLWTPALFAKKP